MNRQDTFANILDDPNTTLKHRDIILKKTVLKKIYMDWYNSFKTYLNSNNLMSEHVLEIGSGGGFLKDVIPSVITSDILPLNCCDKTFSAEQIPFDNNSLGAIFMLNVLHHIPNCENFFAEAQRTLKQNGVIFMIEPANTRMSRWIYQHLHHEPFNPKTDKWQIQGSGPLSDANGAIPWIVFKRDVRIFKQKFPLLHIEKFALHTPFKYLLSGGLSKPSFFPSFAYPMVNFVEKMFTPLYPVTAMFNTIIIKKYDKYCSAYRIKL